MGHDIRAQTVGSEAQRRGLPLLLRGRQRRPGDRTGNITGSAGPQVINIPIGTAVETSTHLPSSAHGLVSSLLSKAIFVCFRVTAKTRRPPRARGWEDFFNRRKQRFLKVRRWGALRSSVLSVFSCSIFLCFEDDGF